jgi:serine/threonine protein kinase
MKVKQYHPTDGSCRPRSAFVMALSDESSVLYEDIGSVGEGRSQQVDLFAPVTPMSNLPLFVRSKSDATLAQASQAEIFRQVHPDAFAQAIDRKPSDDFSRMVSSFFVGVNVKVALSQTKLLSVRWKIFGLYARAVAALHDKQIVHRDLNCETNVLIDVEGAKALLIDFQLSLATYSDAFRIYLSEEEYQLLYGNDQSFSQRVKTIIRIKKERATGSSRYSDVELSTRHLWIPPETVIKTAESHPGEGKRHHKVTPGHDIYSLAADMSELQGNGLLSFSNDMIRVISRARDDDPDVRPDIHEIIEAIDSAEKEERESENNVLRLKNPDVTVEELEDDFFREILMFSDLNEVALREILTAIGGFSLNARKALARLAAMGAEKLFYENLISGDNETLYSATNHLMRLNLSNPPYALFCKMLEDADYCQLICILNECHCLVTGPQGMWFLKNHRVLLIVKSVLSERGFYQHIDEKTFWLSLLRMFEGGFSREAILNCTLLQLKENILLGLMPDAFFSTLLIALTFGYLMSVQSTILPETLVAYCLRLWREGELHDNAVFTMLVLEKNKPELKKIENLMRDENDDLFINYFTHDFPSSYLKLLRCFNLRKDEILDEQFFDVADTVLFEAKFSTYRVCVLNHLLSDHHLWTLFEIDILQGPFNDFYMAMSCLLDNPGLQTSDKILMRNMMQMPALSRFIQLMSSLALFPYDAHWESDELNDVALGVFLYFEQHQKLHALNKDFWEALFERFSKNLHLVDLHQCCIELIEYLDGKLTREERRDFPIAKEYFQSFKQALRLGVFFAYTQFESNKYRTKNTKVFFGWLSRNKLFCEIVFDWLTVGLEYGVRGNIVWDVSKKFDEEKAKKCWLSAMGKATLTPLKEDQNIDSETHYLDQMNLVSAYWNILKLMGKSAKIDYLQLFCKIYRALEQGSSPFFKTREATADAIVAEDMVSLESGAWELGLTFARSNPDSRNAQALILAARYPSQSFELTTNIYACAILASGSFCHSSFRPLTGFFSPLKPEEVTAEFRNNHVTHQEVKSAKHTSRLGSIRTVFAPS